MTDLFVSGPDALELLSGLAVNSFAGFGVGRAKQFVAVDPEGHLIGDAIVFHLEEELFDLVGHPIDRKSTRLNSSHANISYAVFCLKKKKKKYILCVHIQY